MEVQTFGDGPRFSPVTSSDHAGQLWIVTILALVYSSLVSTARAYVKYKMFGIDDILIASATVLQLAQSIAIFVGLGNGGLGKFNSITTSEQWRTSSKSTLAAMILGFLTMCLSKCSLLALILRIIGRKTGKSRPICIAMMVETRWAVITAVDIFTEVAAWLLMVELTWSVNMSAARKFQVIMAFSFRLPLVILSGVHLHYFDQYPSAAEPQFAVIDSLLFQQAMISWSLISATVPNLKNFLKSFSIGMGFPLAYDDTMSGSGGAYALRSFANSRSKGTAAAGSAAGNTGVVSTTISARRRSDAGQSAQVSPHGWPAGGVLSGQTTEAQPYATSSREHVDDDANSGTGSQDMIISKEIAWKITYEERS
ncbi:hypothetical protein ISF_05639 [Cordyceps fumosorosea ARSEF 2679]|uniref:Rhodopsin domain-containing protein n=1 Tax=Cordyceps fumosorosea (strain ARSEF 2679) TaxID=1081104 RepID=A0A167UGN4_CORFA|nr:hypothetical protein ISF_05639 [Cordyceps fumosorosea ARSEF 2679]OAA61560.1 hypothetical protein ISF_05639 [Cordyceps fumosorosea ARSEF 2679]